MPKDEKVERYGLRGAGPCGKRTKQTKSLEKWKQRERRGEETESVIQDAVTISIFGAP